MSSSTPGFPTYAYTPPPPQADEAARAVRGLAVVFAVIATLLVTKWVCMACPRHIQHPVTHDDGDVDAAQPWPPLEPRGSEQLRGDSVRGSRRVGPAASLPAFAYSRSVQHNVTGAGEEAAACSVCLGVFESGEMVRLLPVCLHLYHVECIDPWLAAHSTCPICRSETDPTHAADTSQLQPV
ncbi:hypothetical protein ACP70R_043174 [Stipagrostis hirtigluma subsp. patula]